MRICNATYNEVIDMIRRILSLYFPGYEGTRVPYEEVDKDFAIAKEFIETHCFPNIIGTEQKGELLDYLQESWNGCYWDYVEGKSEESDSMDYIPSATAGDYSPSCPWNAPGMSVSDFLPGYVSPF